MSRAETDSKLEAAIRALKPRSDLNVTDEMISRWVRRLSFRLYTSATVRARRRTVGRAVIKKLRPLIEDLNHAGLTVNAKELATLVDDIERSIGPPRNGGGRYRNENAHYALNQAVKIYLEITGETIGLSSRPGGDGGTIYYGPGFHFLTAVLGAHGIQASAASLLKQRTME